MIVFEGDLGALPLTEVVQMGCVGRQRFWIEVWSDGQQQGAVLLDGGDVAGASAGPHQGDEAFFSLARVLHGRFRVYPSSDLDRGALPATSRPWHELLLETARLSDEDGRPPPDGDEQERARAKEKLGSWRPPEGLPESGTVVIPPPVQPLDLMGRPALRPALPVLAPPAAEKELPATLGPPTLVSPAPQPTPVASPHAAPASGRLSSPDLPASGRLSSPDLPPSGQFSSPARADEEAPLSAYEVHAREATEAYLRRDYAEALRLFEVCLALRPGDRRILHNIERLRNRTR